MMSETTLSFEEHEKLKKLFMRWGFNNEEAEWAVEQSLDPMNDVVRRLMKNRRDKARFLMKYGQVDWKTAVQMCADTRESNNRGKGYEDLLDLFQGQSP